MESLRLDIGCGKFPREGFVGVDHYSANPDVVVLDLEKGLHDFYPANSVDEIWADNVLEHITNLIGLMNSCWLVMKPGGDMRIRVPLANTVGSLKDPTHVRQFVMESFDYFDLNWDYERQPDYGISKWLVVYKELKIESIEYQYIYVVLRKP